MSPQPTLPCQRSIKLAAGLLICVATAATASGQADYEYRETPPGPFHQPVPPWPVEMGFSQDHSSTYAEGVQRGRAALIQAWGNYELSQAQSSILREQARWLRRINNYEATRALHAQQDLWNQRREQLRQQEEARTAEGQARIVVRRQHLYSAIYQLDAHQFDAKNGIIFWPVTLQKEHYAPLRTHVVELFREHVAYGDPRHETARAIARFTRLMKNQLQREIGDLPREEYSAAQKFLLGLEYEAQSLVQQPALTEGLLAARRF